MAQQNQQDEIDLGYIIGKISGMFRSFVRLIFMMIAFFIKYIVVVVILIVIGVALGYFADKNKKEVYKNELIVIPNFESAQYLYDKVDALTSKISDRDTVFLQNKLGSNYKKLISLEAEPIIDLFGLTNGNRDRIEMFKALTEKKDIDDYIEDPQTFQYYKYHRIIVKVDGKSYSEEIVKELLQYLNDTQFFTKYMDAGQQNTKFRITSYEKTISQIDTILKSTALLGKNDASPSVMVNDNSQLNDLIESKERLLFNLLTLQKQQVDEQNVIEVSAINYDILDKSGFQLSNKVKYPVLLLLLFSGFFFLKYLYNKMKHIAETHA